MPRPLRIKDPGAIDHAMHRGDRPEAISASRSQSQGSARQEAKGRNNGVQNFVKNEDWLGVCGGWVDRCEAGWGGVARPFMGRA